MAHVLGAKVRKNVIPEVGWCEVSFTQRGKSDPLFSHCNDSEKIFQFHTDTFDVPKDCEHLALSKDCVAQAFRANKKVYGVQFHLEVDRAMILRWLKVDANRKIIEESGGRFSSETIEEETELYISRSLELSKKTFSHFMDLFSPSPRRLCLGSGHGKSKIDK